METHPLIDGAAQLTHLGVMGARGADASKFLQGQLTNDMTTLGLSQARLAGFCSAKGRLQANFVVWRAAPDELMLACAASVLPATLKRLSMFVLRASCKLRDATAELPLWGVAGDAARAFGADLAVWEKRDVAGPTVIRLPDSIGLMRCLIATPGAELASTWPALSLDDWRWLDVHSGIPLIEAATVEQFVPQMLNYELVGGVDFQKGCYPGQEIVARSHYRGTIKRRMFLFDVDAAAAAGQEVFHSTDTSQPAGMVVNAAPHPGRAGSTALVEVKLAALDAGTLHLGQAEGPLLRHGALPYDVARDSAQPA